MQIFVKAKPVARENIVEQVDETHFVVSVKEPPVQGRANAAILTLLAAHFSVPRANVKIISGFTSRNKIVEVVKA